MELFNNIYAKHHQTVFSYVLVSLNNDHDLAKDCMQDILALILQKLDTIVDHPNPGGFFIITAKNYILKYRTARQRDLNRTVPYDEGMKGASYKDFFYWVRNIALYHR